ncbi:MAG: hypothetical protein KF861_03355 [Planctomycetaceae bacterium]|nr:hypothetical protein [Planctomycetaceae bacterium]
MSRSLLTIGLLTCLLQLICGCGGPKGPKVVEIEGVVTIDGTPAPKMSVEFWPMGQVGTKSRGITDDQGRFVMSTWDGEQKGAVVGRHKVVVRDNDLMKVPFAGRENENVDTTQGAKPRMADKYTNFNATPLEIEVTGDKRDLTIDVEPYER